MLKNPIPKVTNQLQYRAIGIINGQFTPNDVDQLNKGVLTDSKGEKIETVVLGKALSLLKNHIDLKINPNQNFKNFLINKLFKRELKINFEFSAISSNNGFILPHTDGPNKIIGFVLPVIDNIDILSAKKLGTQILSPTENTYKFNYFNRSVPFNKTMLVKEIPFEKNQISLHVKTFNSLHAVGPIDPYNLKKEIFRKSITFFLEK